MISDEIFISEKKYLKEWKVHENEENGKEGEGEVKERRMGLEKLR